MPDTCSLLGIPRDSAEAVTGRSSRANYCRGCAHEVEQEEMFQCGDYQESQRKSRDCSNISLFLPKICSETDPGADGVNQKV